MENLTSCGTVTDISFFEDTYAQARHNLNQGLFNDCFYFGKIVHKYGEKLPVVIFSDKRYITDISKIKKLQDGKKVPAGKNGFASIGFYPKHTFSGLCPTWSDKGITEYFSGKEVDGKELFEKIKQQFDYYLDVVKPELIDLLTLYSITTYCYSLFSSIGYLFFHSQKESGKTKAMNIAALISFNPINATNPSESALFRSCDYLQPTLLIDDYENLEKQKQATINQIIKVGYKKEGQVMRNEKTKDTYEPEVFNVFSPKLISNTKGLDPITLTRCIVLRMLKTKTTKGSREPNSNDTIWQDIRDDCYNFILNNWKKINENYHAYESIDFNNRQLELVKGLLSVAKTINPETEKVLVNYLTESFNDRDLSDVTSSWEFLLFSALAENVIESKYYAVSEICDWVMNEISLDHKPLTRWVGKQLSQIPLFTKKRVGKGVQYFLSPELVMDYMERQNYPIDNTINATTILDFDGEKITELKEPIYDDCVNCGKHQLVSYRSLSTIGKNYCKECVKNDQNKLYRY